MKQQNLLKAATFIEASGEPEVDLFFQSGRVFNER